ncbi:MAG: hypothetical protein QOD30_1855, partial [Actinomycetota bacterium]|nr:hypothetical protein [Actinomycetota bacterium]
SGWNERPSFGGFDSRPPPRPERGGAPVGSLRAMKKLLLLLILLSLGAVAAKKLRDA